jgi:MraZ protein
MCNEFLYFYFIKNEEIMIRFSARYSALIDDKGRVVLPASLKKAMGELSEEPVVVEKDIYKSCLNIYPKKFWDERIAQIEKKLNPFDEGDDDLLAEVYENFTTLMMAQNGRINIPDDFMEHAEIKREDREVIFVGKGQSITLWNQRIYREIKQSRKPLREMFRERLGNNSEND